MQMAVTTELPRIAAVELQPGYVLDNYLDGGLPVVLQLFSALHS